jgi:hypothetical protein
MAPAHGGNQTPHVPPNPIVTWSFSTITGTARRPPECSSIFFSAPWSFLTFTYSKGTCRLL